MHIQCMWVSVYTVNNFTCVQAALSCSIGLHIIRQRAYLAVASFLVNIPRPYHSQTETFPNDCKLKLLIIAFCH
jgi:hypothetical protein